MTVSGTDISRAIAGGKLTQEQALAQLKTAPKSNGGPFPASKARRAAVSVYGLQRMPITLYAEQWERLLAFAEEVKGFIKSHPDLPASSGARQRWTVLPYPQQSECWGVGSAVGSAVYPHVGDRTMTMDVARFKARHSAYQWRMPCWIVLDALAVPGALLWTARGIPGGRTGSVLPAGGTPSRRTSGEQDRIERSARADSPLPVVEHERLGHGCVYNRLPHCVGVDHDAVTICWFGVRIRSAGGRRTSARSAPCAGRLRS